MKARASSPSAFTLVELLVVCAVVGFLGLTLYPALARTQPSNRAAQCVDNARQLAAAIAMYTEDSNLLFPPNPDDGNTTSGHNWCGGYTSVSASWAEKDAFNPDIVTNPNTSLLARYISQDPNLFRCPSDTRHGVYSGSDPARKNKIVPVVRSISMNIAVGTVCAQFYSAGSGHSGALKMPTNGSWLDGSHANRHDSPWATFGKTADFRLVKPSQIFLLADEHPYSINDGCLAVGASQAEWIDYPGSFHDGACTFSFGDGHIEVHRWTGKSVVLTSDYPSTYHITGPGPDYDDWTWVKDHATFRAKN